MDAALSHVQAASITQQCLSSAIIQTQMESTTLPMPGDESIAGPRVRYDVHLSTGQKAVQPADHGLEPLKT